MDDVHGLKSTPCLLATSVCLLHHMLKAMKRVQPACYEAHLTMQKLGIAACMQTTLSQSLEDRDATTMCREDQEVNRAAPGVTPQVTKTIVFSYFTKALDMLGSQLDAARLYYRRLDGGMTLSQRASAVQSFRTDPEVCCLPHCGSVPSTSHLVLPDQAGLQSHLIWQVEVCCD